MPKDWVRFILCVWHAVYVCWQEWVKCKRWQFFLFSAFCYFFVHVFNSAPHRPKKQGVALCSDLLTKLQYGFGFAYGLWPPWITIRRKQQEQTHGIQYDIRIDFQKKKKKCHTASEANALKNKNYNFNNKKNEPFGIYIAILDDLICGYNEMALLPLYSSGSEHLKFIVASISNSNSTHRFVCYHKNQKLIQNNIVWKIVE